MKIGLVVVDRLINMHGVQFSRNHFGRSVVVPNHIFIAFNNQIYKFPIFLDFFHEIIILGVFLMKWKRWNIWKKMTENNVIGDYDWPSYYYRTKFIHFHLNTTSEN
jgi:hypothetical protein